MEYTNRIKIVSLDDASIVDEIDVRLRTLILCTERTIPGSRAFGLTGDFIDANLNEAQNIFALELQEKADIFITEINVDAVAVEYDAEKGILTGTVNVERRREY